MYCFDKIIEDCGARRIEGMLNILKCELSNGQSNLFASNSYDYKLNDVFEFDREHSKAFEHSRNICQQ